jgi:hypothetical protein
MGPGARVEARPAGVAWASLRRGVAAQEQGQQVLNERALSGANRPVNEQGPLQAVAGSRPQHGPPRDGLAEAQEPGLNLRHGHRLSIGKPPVSDR